MKNMKKITSIVLVACIMLSTMICFGATVSTAESDLPSWTFPDPKTETPVDITTYTNETNYSNDAFKYVMYYRGTHGTYTNKAANYQKVNRKMRKR